MFQARVFIASVIVETLYLKKKLLLLKVMEKKSENTESKARILKMHAHFLKKYVQLFDLLCETRKKSEEWVRKTLGEEGLLTSIFVKPFFEMVINKCRKNDAL